MDSQFSEISRLNAGELLARAEGLRATINNNTRAIGDIERRGQAAGRLRVQTAFARKEFAACKAALAKLSPYAASALVEPVAARPRS